MIETTTTTEGTTTQVICDYVQGMSSPAYIPDDQIETNPSIADKSVLRYGVDGPAWLVSPNDQPMVKITLTDPVTGEAPYVKKLIIMPHDNVEDVHCVISKQLNNGNVVQIADTVHLNESGEVEFLQPVKIISITLRITVVPDFSVDIQIKVGILACMVEREYQKL